MGDVIGATTGRAAKGTERAPFVPSSAGGDHTQTQPFYILVPLAPLTPPWTVSLSSVYRCAPPFPDCWTSAECQMCHGKCRVVSCRAALTLVVSVPRLPQAPLTRHSGSGTVDFQEFVGGLSAFSSKGGRDEKLRCECGAMESGSGSGSGPFWRGWFPAPRPAALGDALDIDAFPIPHVASRFGIAITIATATTLRLVSDRELRRLLGPPWLDPRSLADNPPLQSRSRSTTWIGTGSSRMESCTSC